MDVCDLFGLTADGMTLCIERLARPTQSSEGEVRHGQDVVRKTGNCDIIKQTADPSVWPNSPW